MTGTGEMQSRLGLTASHLGGRFSKSERTPFKKEVRGCSNGRNDKERHRSAAEARRRRNRCRRRWALPAVSVAQARTGGKGVRYRIRCQLNLVLPAIADPLPAKAADHARVAAAATAPPAPSAPARLSPSATPEPDGHDTGFPIGPGWG